MLSKGVFFLLTVAFLVVEIEAHRGWRHRTKCRPKCDKDCRKVLTGKFCYECDCNPVCPYLICEKGCEIEQLPEEPCPICVCKEEEVPALDYGEAYARCYPKCGKGCWKFFNSKGCYECKCEPVCPYLRCEKGCTIKKVPEKPCNTCVCKEEEVPAIDIGEALEKCYPKCGKFCRKVFSAKGCYKCDCKPVCLYLKCKEGCSLEKQPEEPCPSCVCKVEEVPVLDFDEGRAKCYPKCEKGCKKVSTGKGCYKCECEPVCPNLKCKEGCTEEKLPEQQCPSCVCKEEEVPALDFGEAFISCYPKCEKGCQKVFSKNKCYKCECEPACPELKCEEGCSPEKLPEQPCSTCVCKEEEVPAFDVGEERERCYPKCEKGCQKVFKEKGCYECKCEPVCPELKCQEGCSPEQLPGESCPSCVCKEEELPVLDLDQRRGNCYPKCEKNCQEVLTEDGCIECDCKPVCPAINCEDKCFLQQRPGEPCPSCVCFEEEISALVPSK
ncbi:uncharacterized protein LOC129225922 isoform X2 [Uloborus diversus]|uniref:uncharacterized protein LOC129225922 isoform X2 n=1 Tax=Uloborus diversus TaxID=327109 RepID=UPI00240A5600|nr:uncharacterized protein LOC129225922 isoform X2 [Uloborus diversus]